MKYHKKGNVYTANSMEELDGWEFQYGFFYTNEGVSGVAKFNCFFTKDRESRQVIIPQELYNKLMEK